MSITPNTLPAARSPSPATLRGWRLTLARAVWALCAAFAVALFLAYMPFHWNGVYEDWLVQSSAVAVARFMIYSGAFANYVLALRYCVSAVSFAVAAIIVWRKSDDGVALMVALGLLTLPTALMSAGGTGIIYGLYGPPWHTLLPMLRDGLAFFALHYIIFLIYIFPDGRFAPHWMKWAALGALAVFGLFLGLSFGWTSWEVWTTTVVAWMTLAVISQIYRYLRVSSPVERQQTKWFVFAIALIPVWLLIAVFGIPGLPEAEGNLINLHSQILFLILIPLGVGISVLRRGLWGADPIINRTLVYGALSVSIIMLYVLIVGGLSALFQSSGSLLLSALVTGAVAFLFQPLRHRLQRLVNRLMYGERDDPATALARLGQRLETAVTPEAVLPSIVQTVAQTLKVPFVELEIDGIDRVTRWPDGKMMNGYLVTPSSSHLVSVPLIFQSETLGHLQVAARAPNEPFSAADRRLLEQIAQQAAPAVHAYRLTADLQRSRERIVTAREEERRRLRRDLHDGLGPTLASQALKLEATLDALETDPLTARAQLGEIKAQTQTLVADVRRLVYDLRPPVLDELGLVSAVREHARRVVPPASGLRVNVNAPEILPPLPAAVEVAAYRIAVEALTNVVKHAQARQCEITFTVEAHLHLGIADDGIGLPVPHQSGVGFASMRERAEELGGSCSINNRQPSGVQVLAYLPITNNQ